MGVSLAAACQARRMRVVTWNVQHARPNPVGRPDVGAVVRAVDPLGADVVAVQELDRGRRRSGGVDQPAALADGLGGQLLWGPAVRTDGEYGVALVVRGRVVDAEVVGLSGTSEPRVVVVAEVEVHDRRWTVACTHLSRDREFAVEQLRVVLDALSARPAPRVLLGDLNLQLAEFGPVAAAAGYEVVDGPATHSTRRRRPTRRIDHVLLSGATATAATVHRFDVSDHAAVVADLV
jgi:endonuclease/exonuclease/phosphatase family metal-dependent hydrolase